MSSGPGRGVSGAGDPRRADADEVRALLHQATAVRSGAVRLPAMTAAELCVLGAMSTALIDAEAWSWWTLAPPARRPALREMAWRFLTYRQLVTSEPAGRQATDPGRVRVAPPAALIVAGRTRPAFIVLCRSGVTGEPEQTRMYGIGDQASGVRALLIEEAKPGAVDWAGPAYEFGLASPTAAGRALARWAASPGPAPPPGQALSRLIDIHLPGTRDIRPAARISVQARSGHLHILCQHILGQPSRLNVTNPLPCDEDVLACLLTDTLTGVCP
ncbi:MAG: hypothetical protein ABSF03_32330 [Streptosporangiaceae bacterium]